jgi:hypothetical protein
LDCLPIAHSNPSGIIGSWLGIPSGINRLYAQNRRTRDELLVKGV